MKRGFIFALLLIPTFVFARKEKVPETVTAYKNGESEEIDWLNEGTTRKRWVVTNYIIREDGRGGHVVLTIKCNQRFIFNVCFALTEGQPYSAVFENRKGAQTVSITGQPGGNLTKPVTMTPSAIVNLAPLPDPQKAQPLTAKP